MLSPRVRLPGLLLLLSAVGCNRPDGKTQPKVPDDTGGGGDGGGEVVYEEGCITVDGEGGYAWINDAIAVADEGSTIELCAGDAHEEAVVVDKAVSIVGPGADAFLLVAPTNEAGVEITASGASLSGIAIESTRAGVEVAEATGVTLSDLDVSDAGTWGIRATDAEDLAIAGCALSGNGYGGVRVDGGSATITDSTITDNTAYGVLLTGGAEVALDGNTVGGTLSTGNEDVADGVGLRVEDSAVAHTTGNSFSGDALVGVMAEMGDLDMSGDTVEAVPYGVVAFYGEAVLADLTVTDAAYQGVWVVSQEPVSLAGLDVSADPETSADLPYDEWGSSGISGTGVAVIAAEADLSDVAVRGYNDCGILLSPYEDSGTATVDGAVIENTGRYGIYVEYMDATITGSSIDGVRDPDDVDDTDCYYVNYIAGLYGVYADITWEGGTITDSEGWGASGVYSSLLLEDSTFSGGECAGVVTYESSLVATGDTFTAAPPYGSIYSLYSSGDVLSGNTFTDNQFIGDSVQTYGDLETDGYTYSWTYHDPPSLIDVFAYDSDGLELTGNTFEHGDASLVLYAVDATLTDNTWTDYRADVITASTGTTASGEDKPTTLEMSDNTFEGFDGNGIYCYGSEIVMDGTRFSDSGTYVTTYDYSYEDSSGYTYSYSVDSETTYSALYFNGCTVDAIDTTMTDLAGRAIYLYSYSFDGSYLFDTLDIARTGTSDSAWYSAVSYTGYYGATSLELTNATITDSAPRSAIELEPVDYDGSSYDATVELVAEDLAIDTASEHGVALVGSRVSASLSRVSVSGAGSYGIYAEDAAVTIDEATVEGAGESGIYLSGTTGSVTNTTATGNGAYGMECDAAELDACDGNDLSGNAAGEQTGCDESCGTEANPGG